jgi:hypothetical protein
MGLHLGKFVHSKTGRIMMSILLGFGLASLFRTICKNKDCLRFHAPPLEEIKDKIYKNNDKCVKYNYVATKCDSSNKIVPFDDN